LRTDDGELILLRAHGFMELNDAWRRAFEEGVASDYSDHYVRCRDRSGSRQRGS
jgi:hypothetical protein